MDFEKYDSIDCAMVGEALIKLCLEQDDIPISVALKHFFEVLDEYLAVEPEDEDEDNI